MENGERAFWVCKGLVFGNTRGSEMISTEYPKGLIFENGKNGDVAIQKQNFLHIISASSIAMLMLNKGHQTFFKTDKITTVLYNIVQNLWNRRPYLPIFVDALLFYIVACGCILHTSFDWE